MRSVVFLSVLSFRVSWQLYYHNSAKDSSPRKKNSLSEFCILSLSCINFAERVSSSRAVGISSRAVDTSSRALHISCRAACVFPALSIWHYWSFKSVSMSIAFIFSSQVKQQTCRQWTKMAFIFAAVLSLFFEQFFFRHLKNHTKSKIETSNFGGYALLACFETDLNFGWSDVFFLVHQNAFMDIK